MNKPNYYAIIPAEVRYSDLKPNAKLLYGEITCLTNKHGYCFATNIYFAELYDVSKNTISLWVKDLKQKGFISVEMIYGNNKQIKERRICIIKNRGIIKNDAIPKNDEHPIIKNGEDNIINNNTINIYIREMQFGAQVSDLSGELQMPIDMANEFLNYWNESNNAKNPKMKFELERTWDLRKRMIRWMSNSKKWNKTNPKKSLNTSVDNYLKAKQKLMGL